MAKTSSASSPNSKEKDPNCLAVEVAFKAVFQPKDPRYFSGIAGRHDIHRAGPNPLEVAGHLAVNDRMNEASRRPETSRRRPRCNVADEELFRDWYVDRPVDVADVPAEQFVEDEIVV